MLTAMTALPAPGTVPPISRVPVVLARTLQVNGSIMGNCLMQEWLGPRTSGSFLNIGAGPTSETYQHRGMLAATEYHTVENDATSVCTYRCSAEALTPIPEARYEWVMSQAMLEHVEDPWAAAREQIRVCKPGGSIFVLTPFAQMMHREPYYSDYWRFTSAGLRRLFAGCEELETLVLGDDPLAPNGIAAIFRTPGGPPRENVKPRHFWVEHRNEWVFDYCAPERLPSYAWPVHELSVEPLELFGPVQRAQKQYFEQARFNVSIREVIARHRNDIARPYAVLGCDEGASYLRLLP